MLGDYGICLFAKKRKYTNEEFTWYFENVFPELYEELQKRANRRCDYYSFDKYLRTGRINFLKKFIRIIQFMN